MKALENKVAIVTGASRGLGAAIAEKLAAEGAKTAVNYSKDHEAAGKVVEGILRAGGAAAGFCYDITDENGVSELYEAVSERFGPPDILVNNATGPQPNLRIEDQTWDHHLAQLEFFVKAPLLLLQAALPSMKKRQYGRVILIGSEVTELGNAEFGHYVAAKAAMTGLTRSWANELGPYGITCNLVAPGWIPVERHKGVPEEEFETYLSDLPLKHLGAPSDIAAAVAFLASDEARFITGQKLAVNGGKTLT